MPTYPLSYTMQQLQGKWFYLEPNLNVSKKANIFISISAPASTNLDSVFQIVLLVFSTRYINRTKPITKLESSVSTEKSALMGHYWVFLEVCSSMKDRITMNA